MTPTVHVRLFAALREEAGASTLDVEASTPAEVEASLARRFGERFARIASAGQVVVNGERATRDTPLADGDEVALLPPVSGG